MLTFGRPPVRVRPIWRSYFYCSGSFFLTHTHGLDSTLSSVYIHVHVSNCVLVSTICSKRLQVTNHGITWVVLFQNVWSFSVTMLVKCCCFQYLRLPRNMGHFPAYSRWFHTLHLFLVCYSRVAAYVTKWWLIRDQVLSYLWIMFANFCGLRFPFLLPKIANGNNLQGDCSSTTNWLIGWRWINGFHYPPLWSRACRWVFWLGCIHLQDPPMQQCNNTLVEEVRWMSGEGVLWIYIIGDLMIVDDRPGEKPSNKVV